MRTKKWIKPRRVSLWLLFLIAISPAVILLHAAGSPPTVSITEPNSLTVRPTNMTLRVTAAVSDPDGDLARVIFFAVDNSTRPATTNKIGETVLPPHSLIVTLRQSTVALFAVATDNSGNSSTSAQANVRFGGRSIGSIGFSPSWDRVNPQTGFQQRYFEYWNGSSFVLLGARLHLFDVPPEMTITNASGRVDNATYLDYHNPLNPGERVTFVIEIAWAENASGSFYTPFLVEPLPQNPKLQIAGQPTPFTSIDLLPTGDFTLAWNAALGNSYAVQHTEDLSNWDTVIPIIVGPGATTTWSDNSETKPSHRFYRLLRVNP